MGDAVDLLALDRDVGRAAAAAATWLARVRRDPVAAADDAPLEGALRHVATRTTWLALGDTPPGHPLREPMRRWILALCLARIGRGAIVRAAAARAEASITIEKPAPARLSPRDFVTRALAERDAPRRRALLDALESGAGPAASAARARDEVLAEIASRLGVPDPRELLWPLAPAAVTRAADELLAATADLAAAALAGGGDLAGLLDRALARDLAGVWPAHLVARTLVAPFLGTPLLEGVALDPGPLPRALGASSWARALARLGAAWSRAAAPRGAPFVLARDATDLAAHRRGALFGALVVDRAFLRHALGLSRDAAAGAARTLACTLLAEVRLEAARALLGDARAPEGDAAERVATALSVRVPRATAHVLPRAEPRAAARLVGALLAARDRAALVERFDEDWFRNPRALAELRAEEGTLAPRAPEPTALDGAPRALARALEELLA